MFKVNNGNTRTMCEICSKLAMQAPERRRDSGENKSRRFFRWFCDFLKQAKVFSPVFGFKVLYAIVFPNAIYIFDQYWPVEFLLQEISLKCHIRNSGFTEIQFFKVEYINYFVHMSK